MTRIDDFKTKIHLACLNKFFVNARISLLKTDFISDRTVRLKILNVSNFDIYLGQLKRIVMHETTCGLQKLYSKINRNIRRIDVFI